MCSLLVMDMNNKLNQKKVMCHAHACSMIILDKNTHIFILCRDTMCSSLAMAMNNKLNQTNLMEQINK